MLWKWYETDERAEWCWRIACFLCIHPVEWAFSILKLKMIPYDAKSIRDYSIPRCVPINFPCPATLLASSEGFVDLFPCQRWVVHRLRGTWKKTGFPRLGMVKIGMVWVLSRCKVDIGDPFVDWDVSELLYLWPGRCAEVFWLWLWRNTLSRGVVVSNWRHFRLEILGFGWIWIDLPAFSRRAFMDQWIIHWFSQPPIASSGATPGQKERPAWDFSIPTVKPWWRCERFGMETMERGKTKTHDIEIGPGCYWWHP